MLYSQREELSAIPEEIIRRFYPADPASGDRFEGRDPHTAYIGRITAAYVIE